MGPSTASTSAPYRPPRSQISTTTARADRVHRSIEIFAQFRVSQATWTSWWENGEQWGEARLSYGTSGRTAPVFVARTGSANPFDGIDVGYSSPPRSETSTTTARSDSVRRSINCVHVLYLSQATWTSSWAMRMASSTPRTPGRRRVCLFSSNPTCHLKMSYAALRVRARRHRRRRDPSIDTANRIWRPLRATAGVRE